MLTSPDTPRHLNFKKAKGTGIALGRGVILGEETMGQRRDSVKVRSVHSDPRARTGAELSKMNEIIRNKHRQIQGGSSAVWGCSQIASINTGSCGIDWIDRWWIYTSVALLKQTGALCLQKEGHKNWPCRRNMRRHQYAKRQKENQSKMVRTNICISVTQMRKTNFHPPFSISWSLVQNSSATVQQPRVNESHWIFHHAF